MRRWKIERLWSVKFKTARALTIFRGRYAYQTIPPESAGGRARRRPTFEFSSFAAYGRPDLKLMGYNPADDGDLARMHRLCG